MKSLHGKERRFSAELAYVIGLVVLAIGTAMMERADFGMSMVVAPAYILHVKLSEILPFFSFGMAEYCLQALIILLLAVVLRRMKLSYLFSFVTAVLYGFTLDGCMALVAMIPGSGWLVRTAFFIAGLLACSVGVATLFHTYISPEAYELFVKEVASVGRKNIGTVKTIYDCVSCLITVVLSFLFFGFGHFVGVKLGTILCALINGRIIGLFSAWLEKRYTFYDAFTWRKWFEK